MSARTITLAAAAALIVAACERPAAPAPEAAAAPPPVAIPAGAAQAPDSFAPIIRRVAPAVVSIDTLAVGGAFADDGRMLPPGVVPGFGPRPVRRGAGSGFLISADGYVVTNNHVVEGAQEVVVSLSDGRQFRARLLGRDPPTDIAVLKVDAQGLPYVSFGRQAAPQVGDWVVAVGNPFGLGGTATAGIVSAYGREIGEAYVSYLQIDAPINAGNSGGPSFDLQGRVVGVNTAIFSPSGGSVGIGFAIPADLAEDVSRQLIQSGRVVRGYLGVSVADLTPAVAAQLGIGGQRGALIAGIVRGGPAAAALRPGDVVTAVNGEAVTGAGGLTRRIAGAKPGDTLRLRVIRDRRAGEVSVRTVRRPDELSG
ncbi:MAG: trypsin-like peptidase domain-containing protein [Phenylobacterium sp.]|uniref:S1C family serine protease n=1 Tax=Phenylobacterium sp. TaxID=1871053 RepID=UPI001A5841EF|nr:trypsin-like peptidase domain-containing protein [Phenylobacterium sp.]MBL8772789.1 trypsin-like peptidase domain-containing protein [Phenylobacterium sp.]